MPIGFLNIGYCTRSFQRDYRNNIGQIFPVYNQQSLDTYKHQYRPQTLRSSYLKNVSMTPARCSLQLHHHM